MQSPERSLRHKPHSVSENTLFVVKIAHGNRKPLHLDQVPRRAQGALRRPDRARRALRFASARDARSDSDYDVAVFLKDMADRWNEIDRIVKIEVTFSTKLELSLMPCLSARVPTTSVPR